MTPITIVPPRIVRPSYSPVYARRAVPYTAKQHNKYIFKFWVARRDLKHVDLKRHNM